MDDGERSPAWALIGTAIAVVMLAAAPVFELIGLKKADDPK